MFVFFLNVMFLSCHSDAYPHIGIIRTEEREIVVEEEDEVCYSEIDKPTRVEAFDPFVCDDIWGDVRK